LPEISGVIGVAIYYKEFPIILIKRGAHHNSRKLFTLLHEYAHLLKGKSAINDASAQITDSGTNDTKKLEAECNRLAAEILVPANQLRKSNFENLSPYEKMEQLANTFKVTYSTAAVCLKRFNLIDQSELSNLLRLRRIENDSDRKRQTGEVKIPRENLMRLDLGRPMFNLVLSAYSSGVLDVFDASKILNLRVNKIDKLVGGIQ